MHQHRCHQARLYTYSFVTNSDDWEVGLSYYHGYAKWDISPSVLSFSKGVLPTTISYIVTPSDLSKLLAGYFSCAFRQHDTPDVSQSLIVQFLRSPLWAQVLGRTPAQASMERVIRSTVLQRPAVGESEVDNDRLVIGREENVRCRCTIVSVLSRGRNTKERERGETDRV